MRTKDELWQVLLATTRMPWIGGDPVAIGPHRYIDGALTCPIPVGNAIDAGATHVLVLQTRPYGVPRSAGGRVGESLIARYLRRLNPALVPIWHERIDQYEELVDDIARRSESPNGGGPYVLGLRPPAGTPCVTQLERRPEILARAAHDGRAARRADLRGVTEIGLGLAALGRPAYINLGHAEDLGPDRSPEALRAQTHAVLDHAYARGRALLRRRALVRAGRGVPRQLAGRPRARRRVRRLQVGLHVHGELADRRRGARGQGPRRRDAAAPAGGDARAPRVVAAAVPDPFGDARERRAGRRRGARRSRGPARDRRGGRADA